MHEDWNEPGWSAPGNSEELLRHFARWVWSDDVRELLAMPKQWLKWALYEGRRRLPWTARGRRR